MVTAHDFKTCALPIMGRAEASNTSNFGSTFVVCFIMSASLCAHVCDEIEDVLPNSVMIIHLLWA